MKGTNTAKVLAMGIAFVIALGVLPLVMAADDYQNNTVQIQVTDSGYPISIQPDQKWFIPGDTIEITLEVFGATDGNEDVFDIIMFPQFETTFSENVGYFDDIVVDAGGRATVTVSDSKTMALPDGIYDLYVGDMDWIEDGGWDDRAPYPDTAWFRIQLFIIIADTDSDGYLPGDDVNVFYSVISIKDGSLITEEAFDGIDFDDREWGVWSEDSESTEGPHSLSEQSGSFDFTISTIGSSFPSDYSIGIWFNGSYGAKREASTFLSGNMWPNDFRVDALAVGVGTDRPIYQIGSWVRVEVNTMVIGGTPEPDVEVEITVLEGTGVTADKISGLGGDDFESDASGKVVYGFSVDDSDFAEDETYTVRVNVSKHLKEAGSEATFDVRAGGRAIAVNMVFNKDVYTTGDTVDISVETAVPEGASTTLTFIYKVTDPASGTKAQEVSGNEIFNYNIPSNFEGRLRFEVEVFNADGDSGMDIETKDVHYAVLLLNVEPQQFQTGNTLTANYRLISTLMTNPTFFFRITDDARPTPKIVDEGVATDGSFQYTVPDVAPSYYDFWIYANQDGVWVETTDRVLLVSGYDIEISVDSPAYSPGDRVTIHYEITTKGDQGLPDKFVFDYGMSNGQTFTWQSDSSTGDIFYTIPSGVNEGDVGFLVTARDGDGNKIGEAGEMLRIQESPNPFEYVRLGDIPLISIILLILVILLIIIMLFRRPSAAPRKAEEPELGPPAEEEAPPPEEAEPMEEAGPLSINCKSCGAAIDITTSKRPIEVMCPSCGETEMVE